MEYNLVHAMFGRFGVLIPLLGLFFELASIITQKSLVSRISGAIVIFGSLIVMVAFLTGLEEISYLMSMNQDVHFYMIHIVSGGVVAFLFIVIFFIRIYLYKKVSDRIVVLYMIIYVFVVMVNLFSNEFIIHTLRGE
ncbi:hypothetical protein SAMN06265182_1890 [Persephonella hydrogeniphila]|uniref:DUF2231 domain-containing protein n=1 Tax=Persephonella hydrogeniphila TaxID=198703 RepID=A0A285NM80_9AQUI|nr:hypothetical protein [Persephonella hydrogeniphila]SNZ10579.1 hypothetical protein SAMN06265182_1890 [Persephonella hydrogeniphila]